MKTQNPFEGMEPPKAPASLRPIVLQSFDSSIEFESLDVWERIWASRRLRFAWLFTVAVLLLMNVVPSLFSSTSPLRAEGSRAQRRHQLEASAIGFQGPTLERLVSSSRSASLKDQLELLAILEGRQ